MLKYIPNILTSGRLVLTVVFLAMILHSPKVDADSQWWFLDIAFVLFVITGLTDIVDGKIARKYNVTSKFGRIMDPLADKVFVCGSFICFALIGQPTLFGITGIPLKFIHYSVVGIIIAREVYVTILRHIAEARGINFAATVSGKLKMFLQTFAIGTVIIKYAHVERIWGDWFTVTAFAIMLIATIVSGLRATKRTICKEATE